MAHLVVDIMRQIYGIASSGFDCPLPQQRKEQPMTEENPVTLTIADRIATIVIDHPYRKNALSVTAANGLSKAWEQVEKDDNVRSAILTSTDCGVFSAGMDMHGGPAFMWMTPLMQAVDEFAGQN